MARKLYSVVLCGGGGSRLWPISRQAYPKQFLKLVEGDSLLAATVKRLDGFTNVICVANYEHRFLIKNLLSELVRNSQRKIKIILEPSPKNTAPAVASVLSFKEIEDDDLVLVVPSDHYIPDNEYFFSKIQSCTELALSGYIITFGIVPTYPATDYGYICRGEKLLDSGYLVTKFIEKPNESQAKKMISGNDYYWNSGIFFATAKTFREQFSQYAQNIFLKANQAIKNSKSDDDFIFLGIDEYSDMESESLDYALMEKTRDMAVVEYSGFWTDLGGWNAVSAIAKVDESRNSVVGNGHLFNSMNTYVHSEKTPTVVVGADNLIVINTVDATLVISKNQTHLLKSSLNSLLDKKIAQVKNHRKVYRPWGWYDLTDSGKNYLVKKVVVKPNQALSLQRHKHRSEHWVVVSGVATVRNGDSTFLLKKNESTYIPVGVLHRLENAGVSDLEIIEVQSGEILDEDDIERFDDNYGRI